MIAPMFWNLCKSSWRKGILLELFVVFLLLVVQDGESSNIRNLGCGLIFEQHSLKDGKEAGLFNKLGRAENIDKCVEYCCDERDCETALFVGKLKACYTVNCRNSEACKPVLTSKTSRKYGMMIFHKNLKGEYKSSMNSIKMNDDPDRPLIREKRHESCHHYHGTQCTKYLENKLLYFNQYPPSVERSLIKPLSVFKQRFSPTCEKYAMAGICHYAFPYCSDRTKPSPTYLCREDCEQLYDGVCKREFENVNIYEGYKKILPDCKKLPSIELAGSIGCIALNIPDSLKVQNKSTISQSSAAIQNNNPQNKPNNLETNEDDLNLFKQKINKIDNKNEKMISKQLIGDKTSLHQNEAGTDNDMEQGVENNNPATNIQVDMPTANLSDSGIYVNTQHSLALDKSVNNEHATSKPSSSIRNSDSSSISITDGKSDLDVSKQRGISETGDSNHEKDRNHDRTEGKNVENSEDREVERNRKDDDKDGGQQISTSASTKGLKPVSSESENKEEERNKGDEKSEDGEEGLQQLPTSAATKRSGLGLQESLGLLEPKESSLKENDTTSSPSPNVNQPTFVDTTNDADETNLALTSSIAKKHESSPVNETVPVLSANETAFNVSASTAPTKPVSGHSSLNTSASSLSTRPATGAPVKPVSPPTEAPPTLQVSAGENKILILPINSIELYASAFPRETAGNPYTYHWQQISAPQDSHGYMEGKDTRRVILSKLSHVGVYQFKVTVKGTKNGAFGVAFVNVTVHPVPRVNKPPRADISPKEQTITLPTNMVVLDGSKSSDDDKIIQYKWEEVKGPLNDKNKMISSGADSPVLQLKSLVPGIYTFKLTVVDSDGEKDSTTATVTVNDEKDYPPVARAGNDVVLTLPINHLTLNGNSSTDDKGIASYEWSKAPSSPAVGDMQGTNSPTLRVSNMVMGDYTFILKVTDTGGQTASSKVTVVVQPEKNTPPVAKAGSDKDLVYPDDSTTLDAKGSHDDQKIVKYHWEQQSGPSSAEISGADEKVTTVKKLQEGHYVFKLTVTDDKGLTGTDIVAVNVKKDINKTPIARAGPDVVVHLPNRAAELDGSKSSDDHGIAEYIWNRDPKSPAAGDVINNSNHQAVLRLSNLVEGLYKFKLTVLDAKGLKSSDEALLTVKEDENSAHLVELYLDVDITKFTEENKGQLIRKLAVILDVQDDDIVVEHLKEAGTGHSMMVMFYVKGAGDAKDGQIVAEILKAKIENEEGFFEFRMLKVEPYICRNNCSFHGYCDRRTKLCVCESFWMQNMFKSSFGVKESNCDWSILYVTVIIFGIVMGIGGIIWGICFCMGRVSRRRRLRDDKVVSVEPPLLSDTTAAESSGRRGRSRRRHRYAIIDEDDDDDKAERMEMLPKGNYSSIMLSDSDEDSDETTLFEAKKRIPNGTLNGSIARKAM